MELAIWSLLVVVCLVAVLFYKVDSQHILIGETPEVHIPIGSIWLLKQRTNDPFPQKGKYTVTVLEVKNGWVRYSMGSVFTNERKDIPMFLAIYTQVTNIQ